MTNVAFPRTHSVTLLTLATELLIGANLVCALYGEISYIFDGTQFEGDGRIISTLFRGDVASVDEHFEAIFDCHRVSLERSRRNESEHHSLVKY